MGTTSETKITTYIFRFSILVTVDMVFSKTVYLLAIYTLYCMTHQSNTRLALEE